MAAPAGGDSRPLPPSPSSKGKAKMDDEAEAEGSWKMCGICHREGRRVVPGELDCCVHYFCFVCIMFWGRIDSRCPFCKARFRTVRSPPVPGEFPDERVVTVPERNQVYHPQGNRSSTVDADPYAETICTVCNGSRDDGLVLLCDLCDAGAHTYCAGLGDTVPVGDWFCKECATLREDQLRWQAENEDLGCQGEFEISIDDVPRAEPVAAHSVPDVVDEERDPDSDAVRNTMDERVPSIYDIVHEDFPAFAGIHRRRPGSNTEDLPLQGASSAGSQHPGLTKGPDNGLGAYHAAIRLEVERARTLRISRNLDKRIRELRENWAALRDGSLGFVPNARGKYTSSVSAATEHQRHTTPASASYRNGASATSAQQPRPSPEETGTSLGHSKKAPHKDAHDARKAWKMLEIAKNSGGRKISSKTASLSCSTPFSMGNRSTSYSPIEAVLGQKNGDLPNKVSQQNCANCGQGTKMESTPPAKYTAECCSLPQDRRVRAHERTISFQNRINQESLNGKVASSIQDQHVDQSLASSSCGTGRLEKPKSGMLHPPKCSSSSCQSPLTSSVQLRPSAGSQSTMMLNLEEPSAVCAATIEVRKSSRADRHERKRKHSSEKCNDEGSKRSRSASKIAKSEISSLAVRELKALKIDKTHGSETFKEVARRATHTVLASCGFEHSPSQSLALSRPVCKHSPKVEAQKSPAKTNSCRECLRSSVKEAISLALSSRHLDQTGASDSSHLILRFSLVFSL